MTRQAKPTDRPQKICPICGRPFTWRKKWAKVWDEVKYCSERCRRSRPKRALVLLSAALLLDGLSATTAPGQALKTAAACEQEYQADQTALKATDETKDDFMAACQSVPVGIPTPIGGSAAPTPAPEF